MGDYWSFFTKGTLFMPFPGFKPLGKVPVIVLLFSWLFFFSSEAQDNFIFDHTTTQNGLAGENVYCLLQDHKGFIWIGTGNGLNRYDGNEFLTFRNDRKNQHSLSNNTITALREDDKGILWIATEGGLNRYNADSRSFDHFILNHNGINQLAANRIRNLIIDHENKLWLSTEGGLFSFSMKDSTWKYFSADTTHPGAITSHGLLAEDSLRGGIWIATDRGLNYFDSKTQTFFNYLNNPHQWKSLDKHRLYGVCVDHDGNIWYSDYRQLSICRFNPEKNELLRLTSIAGKPVTYGCQLFYADRENRLWLSSWTYRMFVMDLNTLSAKEIFHDDQNAASIISTNVKAMLEDREGTLWFGTYNNLSYYSPLLNQFQIYRLPFMEGLTAKSVLVLYEEDDSTLFAGTSGSGLYIFNNNEHTWKHAEFITAEEEKIFLTHYNHITSIFPKNENELWLSTRRGLMILDKRNFRIRKPSHVEVPPPTLHQSLITFINGDRSGNLWIGTWADGLFRMNAKGEWTSYIHKDRQVHSLGADGLLCFLKDSKGRVWLGLNGGGGLCRYRADADDFEVFLSDATKENSLSYGVIHCLAEDADGKIWIGSHGGGLNVFDPEKKIFSVYSQNDGIAGDYIYSIVRDPKGDMWLATNLGLTHYVRSEHKFKNFETGHGLMKNNFGDALATQKGTLLFSNGNIFIEVNPSSLKQNDVPPFPEISRAKIFDKEIPADASLTLSYKENFLSFEFAALSFVQPMKNQYAYFLKGVDRDWNYTNHHFASYPNLLPGNYVFQVKAANNDGVWNDHPAEIKIHINPPWWQTWWFRSLLGIAGIVLLWLGIREYTQRKLRKQKTELEKLRAIGEERTRIARDMHDDLGSGLSTIRLLSEVAKQKLGDEKPPEEIDKIVNSSSELTEKMSEIVWALNSQNDTLESLIAYIRAYAMKYFEEIQLSCKVSLPEKIPSVNLSGEQRRNIFLCVKESLHNIVKHSGATQIEINFLINETFRIEIHDNGKGVDLSNLRQFGNGLKNMQIRMETIGGSFNMKNEQGTTCTFTVPLLQ